MTVRESIKQVLIKRIKEDKVINQVGLANALGVTESAVSYLLKTGNIDLDKLLILCEAIKVTPAELLGHVDINKDREILDIVKSFPELENMILALKNR